MRHIYTRRVVLALTALFVLAAVLFALAGRHGSHCQVKRQV